MATEVIDIRIREDGSRAAAAGIRDVANAATGATTGVQAAETASASFNGMLRSMLPTMKQVTTVAAQLGVVIGGVAAIKGVKNLTDEYTNLINRLRIVSSSAADLVEKEKALFAISQRTRVDFGATVDLYSKLAQAAASLGIDQSKLVSVTELVNKAVAASGASAEAATGGLIQFAQGIASNRLGGEELRSVMENLPALAIQIAQGMGVGLGQMRQLAADGQLTAKAVLDAIEKSGERINNMFSAMNPTLSQSFSVLHNSLMRTLGIMDQNRQISGSFAQAIIFLANNLQTLVNILGVALSGFIAFRAALAVQAVYAWAAGVAAASSTVTIFGQTLTVAAARTGVLGTVMAGASAAAGGLRAAITALWAIIAANPFTALVTIIGAAVAAVYAFGDSISLNSSGSISALGAVVGLWRVLKEAIVDAYNWFTTTIGNSAVWIAFKTIAGAVLEFIYNAIVSVVGLLGKFLPSFAAVGESIKGFGDKVTAAMEQATADMKKTGLQVDALGKNFGATDNQISTVNNTLAKFGDVGASATRRVASGLSDVRDGTNQVRNAFGQLIDVTDEWARRSGQYFNQVADSARSMQAAVSDSTSTVEGSSSRMSSGSGGGSGGGGGFGGEKSAFGGTTSGGNLLMAPFSFPIEVNQGQYGEKFGPQIVALNNMLYHFAKPGMLGPQGVENVREILKANRELADEVKFWRPDIAAVAGFKNGGDFTIGGSGGHDSQLVQFMGTPGERVTVQTPSQQRGDRSSRDGGDVYVTMYVNAKDAESFGRSQDQMVSQLTSQIRRAQRRMSA